MTIRRIGIIGGGAWGTALAHIVATAGTDVRLWARDETTVTAIERDRANPRYLPGITLDGRIHATTRLEEVCRSDAVFLVVPAQQIRGVCGEIASHLAEQIPVICCAKGLEIGTGLLMTEVIGEALLNRPSGCLSGPTFAIEAARGLPTAVTLAIGDQSLGAAIAAATGTPTFRPYLSEDVIGAEVGGAIKNVLAISCGIAAGIGMGENTRAALITRGLAEATRLAVALGGRAETLAGLAGLGDLAMTCASRQSRNFRFGEALGRGEVMDKALKNMGGVVEGRFTAEAIMMRATALGVDLPICQAVHLVLNRGTDLRAAIDGLMGRPLRREIDR